MRSYMEKELEREVKVVEEKLSRTETTLDIPELEEQEAKSLETSRKNCNQNYNALGE
jgi:hypothetical protein